jgi:hypothetical protein
MPPLYLSVGPGIQLVCASQYFPLQVQKIWLTFRLTSSNNIHKAYQLSGAGLCQGIQQSLQYRWLENCWRVLNVTSYMSGPQQAQYYSHWVSGLWYKFGYCDLFVTGGCQVIGCKHGGEAPDEAESQEANWVFVANSHHHSTSGQHKCSGSRCFTSGSLKCHYNQPLGYVAYLETEMLEEMAFIIVAH